MQRPLALLAFWGTVAAGLLLIPVADVRADDLLGRWRNAQGIIIEFAQDGGFMNSGVGSATYKDCSEGNGNVCVVGRDYSCRYRARYQTDRMTLQLLTGRPTKNCPEGAFRRLR